MTAKRRALAQRRKAVSHTQEELAALLGVERSTVVRWETGETEPQPWCRPKLAKILAVSLDTLHELLTAPDELPSQPSDKLLLSMGDFSSVQIGTLMERFAAMDIGSRRKVLQELTIISGTILLQPVRRWLAQSLAAVPLVSPKSVSSDALDALERAVTLFRRWDSSGVGGLRRKAVVGQLNAVAETLHEPHSPAVSQRLFQITAELADMAGWMAFDQGLPGVAQRYYLLGLSACREARSPVLGAGILGRMARLSMKYGHYEDGLDLVHTALYILPHHDSALARTELLGVESRAHAHLGSHAQATRAADTCVEVWRDAQAEAAPGWLHYMSQAEVDSLAAQAYIELAFRTEDSDRAIAHAERAERHALSARESRAPGYDRSRILDEIRLANVRLAQHDVAESVTVAQAALELAAPTSSALVCDRLVQFHGELTARYPDTVHVIPFREQLHEYAKQAAPNKERDVVATSRRRCR
ncbi:MAG: helix-turn-helix transcriptional regulator [Pseudonocardiales bacterium]|nr:helix-turn-helix transcriptional regulator [Pseudonocardiales bacterium]MBV9031738.1 helix-turn-helix transcriptional regulator [Pseudonocardiales bacterium]